MPLLKRFWGNIFKVTLLTIRAAKIYGEQRLFLTNQGKIFGPNNLLIAGPGFGPYCPPLYPINPGKFVRVPSFKGWKIGKNKHNSFFI
ncbi:hypothetical protein BGS_0696 [Beggiatoa sp. SS]|nr:hypothetical protein BGS_0696 [Beggiatoa sp. SS]